MARACSSIALAGLLVALVVAGPAPASRGTAAQGRAGGRVATVAVTECRLGVGSAQRAATFEARMLSIGGAQRLQVRFALQSRDLRSTNWKSVAAEGFGVWQSSDPGVQGYVYDRRVANLRAPAAYRVRVRFRWLDARGSVLARDQAVSGACHELDLRPDLGVSAIDVRPANRSGEARYLVTVRNAGRSAAGPFAVGLAIAGRPQSPVRLLGLAAGQRRTLTIVASRCEEGQPVTAIVDIGGAIDEPHKADNTRTRACPSLPGP